MKNKAPQNLKLEYKPLATQALYSWGNAEITCIREVETTASGQ
jgi:hypothetical protein